MSVKVRAISFGYVLTYLLWCGRNSANLHDSAVEVTTNVGKIHGRRIHQNYKIGPDAKTHEYDRYLGIRYAKSPTGQWRFKPPQPLDVTDVQLPLDKYPRVCPQLSFHPNTSRENQHEDCLFLDIYSPYMESDGPQGRYPVMVYFHGGSYEVGSGALYHGGVLAEMGVVVVLINYRLGALGFMSSGDSLLPGNYGLQDQLASLEWVQRNIELFRGDKTRVTIFGHSVGASSVGLMMIIPEAQGMFHRVIAQSGAATAPYSTHSPSNANFSRYVANVGQLFKCTSSDRDQLVACLRQVDAQKFIEERGSFPMYDPIDPEFRPFVDGKILPDVPRKTFLKGDFNRVPIILGTVKDEFANYFNGGERHRDEFDWALDGYVEKVLHYDQTLLEVVRYAYTDWSVKNSENSFKYLRGDLLSDMHMIAPIVDMADIVSKYQRDVYQYHFSLDKSFHSKELNYVFGAPFSGHFADEMTFDGSISNFSDADRNLSLIVMRMWINFAYNGVPSDDKSSVEWQPYNRNDRNYLNFNTNDVTMRRHLRAQNVAFWNNLMPTIDRNVTTINYEPPPVNVWLLLAAVCVLMAIVLLLTVLFIKTIRDNKKYRNAMTIYAAAHNV